MRIIWILAPARAAARRSERSSGAASSDRLVVDGFCQVSRAFERGGIPHRRRMIRPAKTTRPESRATVAGSGTAETEREPELARAERSQTRSPERLGSRN